MIFQIWSTSGKVVDEADDKGLIDIKDLEGIAALVRKHGEVIIGESRNKEKPMYLEIYDDCRE